MMVQPGAAFFSLAQQLKAAGAESVLKFTLNKQDTTC